MNPDTYEDSLEDGIEDSGHNGAFAIANRETDPNLNDTDGDWLLDGFN